MWGRKCRGLGLGVGRRVVKRVRMWVKGVKGVGVLGRGDKGVAVAVGGMTIYGELGYKGLNSGNTVWEEERKKRGRS